MIRLADYISEAAAYEHLAEEATELAQAALKCARYLRDENPMPPTTTELALEYNLKEEATDVLILLACVGLGQPDEQIYNAKIKRMEQRLKHKNGIKPC